MPFKLYRRGSTYWYSGTVDGRRVRESTRTSDRELATDIASKREWELRRAAVYGPDAVLTFGAAVSMYIEAGKSNRFLLPLFDWWEHVLVKNITAGEIKRAAKVIYPTAGPATWNRQVITPAQAVINHAAEAGLCQHVRVARFKAPKVIRRAVDRNWLDKFIANAPPHLAALMVFMQQTGARVSQATALEWSAVSLQDAIATFGVDKNGDPHVVHLTDEMVSMLANLPKGRKVFGYASRHSVYEPIKRACKRASIEYRGTHEPGRHTFATEMIIRNQVDVATTARLGNWRSHRLLTETYAHPENEKETIERVFGTSVSQKSGNTLKGNVK